MLKRILILTAILIGLLFSCKKGNNNPMDVEPTPNSTGGGVTISFTVEGITLNNGDVDFFSSTSAILSASVPTIAPTNAPIFDHGHMIFDQPPTLEAIKMNEYVQKTTFGEINNPNFFFESTFSDLIPNKTYFYIAYIKATSNGEDFLSIGSRNVAGNLVIDARSFTTISNNFPPGVSTLSTEYISPNLFKVYGIIDETSESTIQEYGFVWKEEFNSLPSTSDNNGKKITGQNSTLTNGHSFQENISVNPNKVYTIRAYAENEFGIDYGESFTIFGDYNWASYNSPPDGLFSICHEERFVNNDRDWDTSGATNFNINYTLSTSGNYYRIDNNEDNTPWNLKTRDIDLAGLLNYQIDLDVKVSQGDFSSGLRWEGNSNNWGYFFGFDKVDKYYWIGYWDTAGNETTIKYESAENILTANDYHKLTIRKQDGRFYLFIDEIFIHDFSDTVLEGDWIMFRCASNSDVYYKNFLVKSFGLCQ